MIFLPNCIKTSLCYCNTYESVFNRLDLEETNLTRSLEEVSSPVLLECPEPPSAPEAPRYPTSGLFSEEDIPIILSKDDYA